MSLFDKANSEEKKREPRVGREYTDKWMAVDVLRKKGFEWEEIVEWLKENKALGVVSKKSLISGYSRYIKRIQEEKK